MKGKDMCGCSRLAFSAFHKTNPNSTLPFFDHTKLFRITVVTYIDQLSLISKQCFYITCKVVKLY